MLRTSALIFTISFLLFFTGWRCNSNNEPVEIIILHTNDIHAKIDNFSKLAAYVSKLRSSHKNVFLVNAGDIFSGNPIVDQYKEKGYPVIDLMNQAGFDVSTLGNHEFDYGQDILVNRIKDARFPFVCSNMKSPGGELAEVPPFIVLTTDGALKIAFLGITQTEQNGLPDAHPDKVKGIKFYNGLETVAKYQYLKNENNILVVISHNGFERDSLLALKVSFADVIVGGHSHKKIFETKLINNVLVAQAGSDLNYLGQITLTVKDGIIIAKKDSLIDIDKLENIDKNVEAAIIKYNNNETLKEIIGIAKEDIKGEPELGSLMTDALTGSLGVDIAFQNNGGIRVSSMVAGNITTGDIFKLDPFCNQVYKFMMTTDEIKSLIGFSVNKCDAAYILQTSGITYKVKKDNSGKLKSIKILMNGKELDPKKTYSVAMNSYIAKKYEFNHNDPGEKLHATSAETLIEYIKAKKTLNYKGVNRATILSEKK